MRFESEVCTPFLSIPQTKEEWKIYSTGWRFYTLKVETKCSNFYNVLLKSMIKNRDRIYISCRANFWLTTPLGKGIKRGEEPETLFDCLALCFSFIFIFVLCLSPPVAKQTKCHVSFLFQFAMRAGRAPQIWFWTQSSVSGPD